MRSCKRNPASGSDAEWHSELELPEWILQPQFLFVQTNLRPGWHKVVCTEQDIISSRH